MKYKVAYRNIIFEQVEAKTPGSAVHKFLRQLIKDGVITKKPKSTLEGGWEGVTVEPINGWRNKR